MAVVQFPSGRRRGSEVWAPLGKPTTAPCGKGCHCGIRIRRHHPELCTPPRCFLRRPAGNSFQLPPTLTGSASTQSESCLAARERQGLIQPGEEKNLVELRVVPSLLSSRGEKKAGSMLTQSISPCLIAENNRAGKLVEEIHMSGAPGARFQPLSGWLVWLVCISVRSRGVSFIYPSVGVGAHPLREQPNDFQEGFLSHSASQYYAPIAYPALCQVR